MEGGGGDLRGGQHNHQAALHPRRQRRRGRGSRHKKQLHEHVLYNKRVLGARNSREM